jgi:RHH-type proline utilization regulon transcriptional repressor/proline dehydrogenase/delta 1-pyrroline-5-carboxylate dehydrogenase
MAGNANNIEAEALRIGRRLLGEARTRKSKISGAWLNSKIMDFAMQNEDLKVQLFRFVDVLPTLRSHKEVSQHLKEYFGASGQKLSGILSWGASLADSSSMASMAAAMAIRRGTEEMARTFIAGKTPKEAVKKIKLFRKFGMVFTLDMLGEAVVSETEADAYFRKYMDAMDVLSQEAPYWKDNPLLDASCGGGRPRINLSLKLSALYSGIDPVDPIGSIAGIKKRLVPLLLRASEVGAFVNIDMEDYRLKGLTLDVFRDVAMMPQLRNLSNIGIVIQAYLKDSLDDVRNLVSFSRRRDVPFTIRLVKGAYWDYEQVAARQHGWPCPVYMQKYDTDANFEACARLLLESHPHVETALASHNIRSISYALAVANELGLDRSAYEMQALYGMAQQMNEALADDGYRVRIYMPFGELLPGMAYLVRRLLENTSNESFLRKGFVEGKGEDELLASPARMQEVAVAVAVAVKVDTDFENEPDSRFFDKHTRAAFDQAIDRVRGQFGSSYPLVIGGKEMLGHSGDMLSTSPSDRSTVVGRVALASVEQADLAVAAAKKAFPAWRDTPLHVRAEGMRKVASYIRARKYDFGAWMVFESGKPRQEADGDVSEAIDFLEYYANEAQRIMAVNRRCEVPGEVNEDYMQPRGVSAVIAPWNFPLAILTGMASAALVTGNTVIMKPAEQSPVIAAKLMDAFREAGLPDGVLNYLPGAGETVGARLVEHHDVNLVAFTGSREVGLRINAAAGATREGQQGVKKVVCEMGGKNAIVVDSDADLDEAVAGVVRSAFGYAGQKCSACSRAIVVGSAYGPFVDRVVESVRSLVVAPAEHPECMVPPVIDDESMRRVQGMIEEGKGEAFLAVHMEVGELSKKGAFVGPTVFVDVPPRARIAQDEIFGPVLCVMRAESFRQALDIAMDVPYALTGGVYSRSPANIDLARREFRVGNLYVNRNITGAKVCRQPFGGFKMSGIGSKAGGPEYLLQFVEPRTVTENTMRRGFAPKP